MLLTLWPVNLAVCFTQPLPESLSPHLTRPQTMTFVTRVPPISLTKASLNRVLSHQDQAIRWQAKNPSCLGRHFCNIRNNTTMRNPPALVLGRLRASPSGQRGRGGWANEWGSCTSSLPSECTATASNCINEFPGDWTWSWRGLVKLGFRNPFFRNAVLGLPAVKASADAVRVCPAASTGQPRTCCPPALHGPRPGSRHPLD